MISVTIDDRAARRMLDDVEYRQIPFATSLALNNTMKDVQETVRTEHHRVFTVRNKALVKALTTIPRGQFATKHRLRVWMGNVRGAGSGFIERQVTGGIKTPRGSAIAIPVLGKGMRRNPSGSIPKGKRAKNRADLVRLGNVLYERQKRRGLVPRFILTKSARPSSAGRFRYVETGTTTARERFEPHWQRAMQRAVKTAYR